MILDYDIRTLAIGSGCVSFIFAAWLIYFGWGRPPQSYFRLWTAASLLQGTGLTLVSFRDSLPDFMTIIVANSCIVLFLILLYTGFEHFEGLQSRFLPVSLTLLLLVMLVFIWATYVFPSIRVRFIVISACFAAISIHALTGILRSKKQLSQAHTGPGVAVLTVLVIWNVFTMLYTLFGEAGFDDLMTAGNVLQLAFFVNCSTGMVLLLWIILLNSERLREKLDLSNKNLQHALDEVKTLRGIVPICAACKKIRNDEGFYESVEAYVTRHTEAHFSHSVCPDCAKTLYPEYVDKPESGSASARD